jgi:hypothetical protein
VIVGRRSLGAAFALLAASLAAGCGGRSQPPSAADFVRRITTEFSRGQAGRLWDELHPAEQAVVTRAWFVACEKNSGFRLRTFKVLENYDDTVDVAGKSAPSTAVTVQVTSDDGVTTATLHAVRVDSAWRWILQPADLAAYARGRCPGG